MEGRNLEEKAVREQERFLLVHKNKKKRMSKRAKVFFPLTTLMAVITFDQIPTYFHYSLIRNDVATRCYIVLNSRKC